ncbi:MAG TPA: thiol reductant ABC exporter subunit CydD [Actinomycetes bacterium]|nr:thiol reductant ABC exporter subunit CydD [Actinomycetes bacterium]
MRPFDPRLLRYARATRGLLIGLGLLAVVQAAVAIALAGLIAFTVTAVFESGETLAGLAVPLGGLLAVIALRAMTQYLQESWSARASARVKAELADELVAHVAALGPSWLVSARRSRLVVLLSSGLDALDEYFARYLPQLVASLVVPVLVLVALAIADPLSAVIVAVTLPLIPLFMVLIGWRTQVEQQRQWNALQTLGGHFLDVLRGLVTLKVFGRADGQAVAIAEVSERYRRRTMRVLRISFLSSFTLELLATLSVAIVAVEIGLRLVGGGLNLRTALFVLVLAPEAYLPLRQVGVHYHASQAGLAAAEELFGILEVGAAQPVDGTVDLRHRTLQLDGITVQHDERVDPSLVTTFDVKPGETLALVGPSGGGKSTALGCLLGIVEPTSDVVRAGDSEVPAAWRSQIAWMPQHPGFVRGSIAENVRVVAPAASDAEVEWSLQRAGADFVADLPQGIDTLLGEGGEGLSVGQRQRLALARVFVRQTPVAVLDEPTAGLDGGTERTVVSAISSLRGERTVVVVAHRPALADQADRVVVVAPPARAGRDA